MKSSSRYATLYFYILKKDRLLQLVQDYKKLNQHIIKNKTPLPFLIGKVIDKLKEAKYFNKLDLIWGYNNVWIKKGDEWKAVFLTNKGLFKSKVMYFELYNLLGIFQRMINSIFQELLHDEILENYMDDFIISTKTKNKLEKQTICFLKIAEKHNHCFKWSKSDFDTEEILILGVIVGRGEVQMENDKVKTVTEWKTSTKIKEVKNFLGFVNFYWQFIKRNLINLKKKSQVNLYLYLQKEIVNSELK